MEKRISKLRSLWVFFLLLIPLISANGEGHWEIFTWNGNKREGDFYVPPPQISWINEYSETLLEVELSDFSGTRQRSQDLCWAAALESILATQRIPVDQYTIADSLEFKTGRFTDNKATLGELLAEYGQIVAFYCGYRQWTPFGSYPIRVEYKISSAREVIDTIDPDFDFRRDLIADNILSKQEIDEMLQDISRNRAPFAGSQPLLAGLKPEEGSDGHIVVVAGARFNESTNRFGDTSIHIQALKVFDPGSGAYGWINAIELKSSLRFMAYVRR